MSGGSNKGEPTAVSRFSLVKAVAGRCEGHSEEDAGRGARSPKQITPKRCLLRAATEGRCSRPVSVTLLQRSQIETMQCSSGRGGTVSTSWRTQNAGGRRWGSSEKRRESSRQFCAIQRRRRIPQSGGGERRFNQARISQGSRQKRSL